MYVQAYMLQHNYTFSNNREPASLAERTVVHNKEKRKQMQ